MTAQWRRNLGLIRSMVVYCRPGRQQGLRRLYRPFVRPGRPVFDIGAHLGDRSRAFAALGGQVIALEPQPHVFAWLRWLCRRHPNILLLPQAAGAEPGYARLAVSSGNPTVSSMAADWRRDVTMRQPGFRQVSWDDEVEVPVRTLDQLIDTYGLPSFCKIDVEGYEADVLAGLSRALPALSVEFIAGMPDNTLACMRRLQQLGDYRYNLVAGEQRRFLFRQWLRHEEAVDWIRDPQPGIASGDLYARLRESGAPTSMQSRTIGEATGSRH